MLFFVLRHLDTGGAVLNHYITYHNPTRMGYDTAEADLEIIVTNKSVAGLIGDMIWVITGKGQPRSYYLCSCFVVSATGSDEDSEFKNWAQGSEATMFQPPLSLNHLPWFPELRKSQANFSLGLQRIKDEFVPLLKSVAETASYTRPNNSS